MLKKGRTQVVGVGTAVGGGTGRPRGDGSVWVEGGGVEDGGACVGFFFFRFKKRERMRDGDPVQVQRIQERQKHSGGLAGVVRWYRTITGVGETGGGWYWWATCGEGRTGL